MFAEKVNISYNGNEDWGSLQGKLLDVAGEVCGYTNEKHKHSETRRWKRDKDATDVERGICLGLGSTVRLRKTKRNSERKDAKRIASIATCYVLQLASLGGESHHWFFVVMVMSYSELQNKRQRKSVILLGKLSQRWI